jgi:hypothetical protein
MHYSILTRCCHGTLNSERHETRWLSNRRVMLYSGHATGQLSMLDSLTPQTSFFQVTVLREHLIGPEPLRPNLLQIWMLPADALHAGTSFALATIT